MVNMWSVNTVPKPSLVGSAGLGRGEVVRVILISIVFRSLVFQFSLSDMACLLTIGTFPFIIGPSTVLDKRNVVQNREPRFPDLK